MSVEGNNVQKLMELSLNVFKPVNQTLWSFIARLIILFFTITVYDASPRVAYLLKALLHHRHVGVELIVNSRLCHSFPQVVVEEQGVQDDLFVAGK